MSALICAVLLSSALALVFSRKVPLPADIPDPAAIDAASTNRRRVLGSAVLAGLALWIITGTGVLGAVLGVATTVIAARLLTRLTGVERIDTALLQRQASEAAELMAACLASGATLQRTTAEVARALDDPLAGMLLDASSLMAMGATAEVAWAALAGHDATAPIARAIIRSAATGAPSAEALLQVAIDLRNRRHAAAQTRVRSVAVATVGPLGLCFLPAFLLLGVVPVVASLIGSASAGR